MVPVTMTYRPYVSTLTSKITKLRLLFIKIATPLDLLLKFEWKYWLTQLDRSREWSETRRWVSCKKTTSGLRRFSCRKILVLLTGPFTFHERNLILDILSLLKLVILNCMGNRQSSISKGIATPCGLFTSSPDAWVVPGVQSERRNRETAKKEELSKEEKEA